ncbi:MAG: hypothetical protein HKN71_02190 [Gemmatimonadetes bacterium]|nr:hypothetical protein [Gemmatimonadota bacterium]
MSESEAGRHLDLPQETPNARSAVRRNGPEVRTRLTQELYDALQREAGALGLSLAECVRRVLQAHYDRAAGRPPELLRRLDELADVLEQAQGERELLVGMLDLIYKGLLIRLERPSPEDVERRSTDAAEGYERWKVALERSLGDGAFDSLLRLVEKPTNT